MLPSCVPATPMDESGANLDYRAIDSFHDYPRVQGLAEMMNSYSVIHNDPEVVSKIVASQAHHKKIDGHAPGLQVRIWIPTSPPASIPTTNAPHLKTRWPSCSAASSS